MARPKSNLETCNLIAQPIDRRSFLRRAALLSASGIVLLSPHAWAARTLSGARKRLVVVFLRGAVDGLNVVVPHGESDYYESRPTIAIGRERGENGAANLDGFFGLHPALTPMMDFWHDGSLAFVHACGSPDPTRSHFDAQDYMESGTPGIRNTPDGWMNRVLAVLPGAHPATEAVSLGPVLPRIVSGKMPVANIATGRAAERPTPMDFPQADKLFDTLYTGKDALSRAYREGRVARRKLFAEIADDMVVADAGAPSPAGFSDDTDRLARLIARDASIRLAFMSLGGWDTHVSEGSAEGQLANHLRGLGQGLASFARALGPAWSDTVVLVISEFGRTVHENGNGGTDHGHGNVMWVMGGNIRGRKVYGRWPGLAPDDLYQGRDLAITTDFREIAAAVLHAHMGLDDAQIDRVFPGRPAPGGAVSGIIRV
jgi:uncharacterized protein (DUF1501 family)